MGSASRISNYSAVGVAQLISMYSKPRGALVALAPVVLGISPNTGPAAGGTLVRITGYNFENVSSVTIGGAACTGLIVGGGIITCYSPAGSGAQNVVVTGPGGASTLAGGFIYPGSAFDPATLSLTGWWRASYAGSPWPGIASAGSSSGRNLAEATNPPSIGTALNGLTPANFEGTDDIIASSFQLDSFVSSGAWYVGVLARAGALAAAVATFIDACLITEPNGQWGIAVSASGARAFTNDGANKATGFVTFGTSTWTWIEAWYDGTTLSISSNGGTPATVAAGSLTSPNLRTPTLAGSGASSFFNGQIAEVVLSNATLLASRANLKSYINTRYGLSL